MAKSASEYEKEILNNIVNKTGKSIKEWMKIIPSSGEEKVTKITKWLKTGYSMNHAQANVIASVFLNDGKPVYGDFDSLFIALLEGKDKTKPVYKNLINSISGSLNGYKIVPRKTYVQLDDERGLKRCFAVIKINKTNVRLGLDLGEDHQLGNYVQKAKSLGAMPRFSHMIGFKSENEINNEMIEFIEKSRERSA